MNVGVYQASREPNSVRLQKVNIAGCGSPCNAGGNDFSLGRAALFLKILLYDFPRIWTQSRAWKPLASALPSSQCPMKAPNRITS